MPGFAHILERILIALLCTGLMPAMAFGGADQSATPSHRSRDMGDAGDGIKGLVVNETITPNGYEFYRMFALDWSEKANSREYSLHVREKLSKRFGNRVEIFLGERPVYSKVLPAKYEQLRTQCAQAADEVEANIVSMVLQASDDTDIVRDEI